MDIKKGISALLKKELGLKDDEILIEIPPDQKLGNYAFPCFLLSKRMKKSAAQISQELSKKISEKKKELASLMIAEARATGPYINFFLKKEGFSKGVVSAILDGGEEYGSSNTGKGKKILIEHTSINPNASPHLGRARNALIGDSIVRIMRFQGYKTDVHYFVNDVGKQIAMLVLGAEGKKRIEFDGLLKIYVDINKRAEDDPAVEKKVFELLNKLEKGDKEVKKRFHDIVDICIKGQSRIMAEIGIKYDSFDYESGYLWNRRTEEILAKLEKTGKLSEDEESRMVLNQEEYNLPTKAPFLVLTRADKTSLYPLRDIAYTIDKLNSKAERNIVVLGEDQKLYFQQLKAALDALGYKSPEVVHYSFVLLLEGKMSTRKGNVVLLEEFMKEAVEKAEKELKKRHDKFSEKTAKAIAYAAVKYAMLKVSSEKNVNFDWDAALSFEGESGPYLLYSYARASSVLGKAGKSAAKFSENDLAEQEFQLIEKMSKFKEAVDEAYASLKPHVIANYAYTLCQQFNEFYHSCPVLSERKEIKERRLAIIECFRTVLKSALGMIGIEAIEKM